MKDNTTIHKLAAPGEKSGKIRFIHKDGKEHCFYTCVNNMSGSRMSWFDNDAPDINGSLAYIRSVFRDIRKKAQVIEVIGDY
jgi:hypothetical protein